MYIHSIVFVYTIVPRNTSEMSIRSQRSSLVPNKAGLRFHQIANAAHDSEESEIPRAQVLQQPGTIPERERSGSPTFPSVNGNWMSSSKFPVNAC